MNGLRQRRQWAIVLALISVSAIGAARSSEPIRAEPQSLEAVPAGLIERLRADPYVYFRFVNRAWIGRVCEVFGKDVEELPVVRLHGDAHVEQFAVMHDAWNGIGRFCRVNQERRCITSLLCSTANQCSLAVSISTQDPQPSTLRSV